MNEALISLAVVCDNVQDSKTLADCIDRMNTAELREFQRRVGGLFKGVYEGE